MNKLVALLAISIAAAIPANARAQAQSPEQQACIVGVNKAGAKVTKAQGREAAKCVKSAGKAQASLNACVTGDPSGKVGAAGAKTTQTATDKCGAAPDYGYAGSTAVNAAAAGEAKGLVRDVLGDDLDAAVISAAADKAGAACQSKVLGAIAKIADAKLATFNACKQDGLKDGSVTTAAALAACLNDVASDIGGKIGKAVTKLSGTLTSKCEGVNLDTALPGDCSGMVPLSGCLDRLVECRACRILSAMDALGADCDTFDDGVANASCSNDVGTTTTTMPDCAANDFLDVSGAAGPGGMYAGLDPSVSATCSANTVTVQSNGIPTYQYVAMTPNGLQTKNYTFMFPRFPAVAPSTTPVPLLGNMGVAVNGIPLYTVNEGAMPASDAYGDPIAAAILDECGSHSAQMGTFHYHKLLVKCLIQSAVSSSQPWNNPDPSPTEPSPIIAYAFDGFPIYGPYECTDLACTTVQEMLSSWDNTGYEAGTEGCASSAECTNGYCTDVMIAGAQNTACVPKTCVWSNNTYTAKVPSAYLDQCNGHVGPGGDYHYHATSTFPYSLGCYSGTPTSNGGTGVPPGGTCP